MRERLARWLAPNLFEPKEQPIFVPIEQSEPEVIGKSGGFGSLLSLFGENAANYMLGSSETRHAATAYTNSVWAYRSINHIASNIAQLPLKVVQKNADGEDIDISDDPSFALFGNFNPQQTRYEFIWESIARLLHQGELFWELQDSGNGNGILAVYADWLSGQVKIKTDPRMGIIGYKRTLNGRSTDFTADQVFFLRMMNLEGGFRGLSPLQVARHNLTLDRNVNEFNKQFFKQGMKLSGFLEMPGSLNDADRRRYTEVFKQQYHGVSNLHGTAVFPSGVKFHAMNQQIKGDEFETLKTMSREEVVAAYGLSIEVFGLGNTTHANKEEARKQAWQDTILPTIKCLSDAINKHLIPRMTMRRDVRIEFDRSGVEYLKEDIEEKAKTFGEGVDRGAITPNEYRQLVHGLDPIDDPLMDLTSIQRAPVMPEPDDEEEPSEDDPQAGAEDRSFKALMLKSDTAAGRADIWRSKIADYERHEKRLAKALEGFFNEQAESVREEAEEFKASDDYLTKDTIYPSFDRLFDFSFWFEKLKDLARPFIGRAFVDAASEWTDDLSLTDPVVDSEIGRRVQEMSRFVNETTGSRIRTELQLAVEAGESIDEMIDRIMRNVFDDSLTRKRARLIARTEAVGASNRGSLEGLRDGGWPSKMWITSRDSRVRDSHEIDGQIKPLRESFVLGDGTVMQYPHDFNERCIIIGSRQTVLSG